MNKRITKWSRRYQAALRKHLKKGQDESIQPAPGLGRQAVAFGLQTLDVAKIHEQAMIDLVLLGGSPRTRQKMIERATTFFAETIVPIEGTHRAALNSNVRVNQLTRTLNQRIAESSASTRNLKRGVGLRKEAEVALKRSGKKQSALLTEAHLLQKHLRHLSRDVLSKQENERRKSSRHLQDEIAQTLLAINLRLLMLKTVAKDNRESFQKEIASTQLLVRKSTKKMRQKYRQIRL